MPLACARTKPVLGQNRKLPFGMKTKKAKQSFVMRDGYCSHQVGYSLEETVTTDSVKGCGMPAVRVRRLGKG